MGTIVKVDEKKLFFDRLSNLQKIAAVKEPRHIEKVLEHKDKISAVFLMTGTIMSVKGYVDLFRKEGLPVFIHIEKISGLSINNEGIDFIANYVKPIGIVTTKPGLILKAKKHKLMVVQRVFMIDSEVYKQLLDSMDQSRADILEIMPSRLPHIIRLVSENVKMPVITGGLLSEVSHVKEALESGALAVTTSNIDIWKADLFKQDVEYSTL
ncbi:glycerol-3-phosphate responsive antiterminator [Litchfieldia salsa]|uniref:Glycerol uptake operon antiterminator regulatory protein n=1 Tax=Litchfieldia salsa TaxID=930152 RepID=A0A1H0VKN2_9BACI|nr:glycerol-3-phosphate responsive antiterminator [Litchfieldia salsa]SDP78990.1 glycerol uptake operon antiterminator [Litchfieldia salsa]